MLNNGFYVAIIIVKNKKGEQLWVVSFSVYLYSYSDF